MFKEIKNQTKERKKRQLFPYSVTPPPHCAGGSGVGFGYIWEEHVALFFFNLTVFNFTR